jgi:hypothetical protein
VLKICGEQHVVICPLLCVMLTCFVLWKSRISMMQYNGPFIKLDALKTIHVSHLHMEHVDFYGNTCILYLGGTCF